jgi:hypothetical protein
MGVLREERIHLSKNQKIRQKHTVLALARESLIVTIDHAMGNSLFVNKENEGDLHV